MGAVRRRVPRKPGARETTELKRKGEKKEGGREEKGGGTEKEVIFFKKWMKGEEQKVVCETVPGLSRGCYHTFLFPAVTSY